MRSLWQLGALVLGALSVLAVPTTASAATSCAWDDGSKLVTVTLDGSVLTATVGRDSAASTALITVDGATCDASARVDTTETIAINGTATANEVVTVQLAAGGFAPGATDEGASPEKSEIELTIDLGDGAGDQLLIAGTTEADTVYGGASGVAFNADEDVDATVTGAESIRVESESGNDTVRFDGSTGGTGDGACTVATELIGGVGNDTLRGGAGADTIEGGSGTDVVEGGLDSDTLVGGADSDTISYASHATDVTVALGSSGSGGSDGETDSLSGFERVVGGTANDIIDGDGAANTLNGGGGDDTISGAGGNDQLVGGTGNDTLAGGPGNDTFSALATGDGDDVMHGETGTDTVTYAQRTGKVVVSFNGGASDGSTGEGDLAGVDNEILIGGKGADTLVGSNRADRIYGGPGRDQLAGNLGKDKLYGGDGSDVFFARDRVRDLVRGGAGIDKAYLDRYDRAWSVERLS